jgi:peptide/nickel transport system permease protein
MSRPQVVAATALLLLHVTVLLAGLIAPHEPSTQYRNYPYAGPGVRPTTGEPEPSSGAPGKLFLLGTDSLGRDQFSRLLHGGRISLFTGVFAAILATGMGTALGLLSGYHSGMIDQISMRLVEFVTSLPWLFLLLGARAALPLDADPVTVLFTFLGILAITGAGRPARVVRGLVLTLRERHYVAAARGFGAGHFYLLRRHILPELWPVARESALLAAPQFVLAEVTLSFLGLGINEPAASWGTMLAGFARIEGIESAPWLVAPAVALAITCFAYRALLTPDEAATSD